MRTTGGGLYYALQMLDGIQRDHYREIMDLMGAEVEALSWDWPGELLTLGTPEFAAIGDYVAVGSGENSGRIFRRVGGQGRNLRVVPA